MALNKPKMSAYALAVQHGLAIANRKMMEKAAAFDLSLVISRDKEHFVEKSAKELLEESYQTDWWKSHFESI